MKKLKWLIALIILFIIVSFLPIFPCVGCGLITFENFYTVFLTNECKCCAPALEFHGFDCRNETLSIRFRHYHFCKPVAVSELKVKLGIKSENITVWKVYKSTDIGTWDTSYLKSYESTPVSWTMHKWFFRQIESKKKLVIIEFGPSHYWSETPWMNLSEICS